MCDVVYVLHLDLLAKLTGPGYFDAVAEFDRNLHEVPAAATPEGRDRAELKRAVGL